MGLPRLPAVEALQAGRKALIIDLDHNGPEATVARLIALGAPEDQASRSEPVFRYCEPEDRTERTSGRCRQPEWRPAVAVVDSIGELLPMHGVELQLSRRIHRRHTSNVLKPLAKAGAAVLAVDHLAKARRFARPRPWRHRGESPSHRRRIYPR